MHWRFMSIPARTARGYREPYYSELLKKSARNIDRGAMVLVIEHGRTTIILPYRGVDLGVLGQGDRIALAKTR